MVQSFGLSDVGCVRAVNQDRILIDETLGLFLVADGMGGPGHGEVAADLAIVTIRYYIAASRDRFDVSWPFGYDFDRSLDENRLTTAIQLANRQVWNRAGESPECAGMGTTAIGVVVNGDRAAVANVGDSRVYLMRNGTFEQLTTDDTWVGNMVRTGALTADEAARHSMKSVLTQAVGSHDGVQVHTLDQELRHGDMLLLCTDGIHGVIEESALRSMLYTSGSLEHTAKQLIESAKNSGAPDNASCVVVRYEK